MLKIFTEVIWVAASCPEPAAQQPAGAQLQVAVLLREGAGGGPGSWALEGMYAGRPVQLAAAAEISFITICFLKGEYDGPFPARGRKA